MSSDVLKKKFDLLTPEAQRRLMAFWDLLLAHEAGEEEGRVMSDAYRKGLSEVGVWSEVDLAPLAETDTLWQWPPRAW